MNDQIKTTIGRNYNKAAAQTAWETKRNSVHQPSIALRELLRAKPVLDPALPGSLLAGLGSSLVEGGDAQKNVSRSLAKKYHETLDNQTRVNSKNEFKELAQITLKKKLKPLESVKKTRQTDHYGNILASKLNTIDGLF